MFSSNREFETPARRFHPKATQHHAELFGHPPHARSAVQFLSYTAFRWEDGVVPERQVRGQSSWYPKHNACGSTPFDGTLPYLRRDSGESNGESNYTALCSDHAMDVSACGRRYETPKFPRIIAAGGVLRGFRVTNARELPPSFRSPVDSLPWEWGKIVRIVGQFALRPPNLSHPTR